MKAKGVIRSVLSWPQARNFFIWRLRRRLEEEKHIARLRQADASLSNAQALGKLKALFLQANPQGDFEADEVRFSFLFPSSPLLAAVIINLH